MKRILIAGSGSHIAQALINYWQTQGVEVLALAHVHVAQAIQPLLNRNTSLRWMSLSAMVGSISDNQLGGWYSYRMSKAALYMFIKTLSIEWQRKAPQSIVVATHPGTTDNCPVCPVSTEPDYRQAVHTQTNCRKAESGAVKSSTQKPWSFVTLGR